MKLVRLLYVIFIILLAFVPFVFLAGWKKTVHDCRELWNRKYETEES